MAKFSRLEVVFFPVAGWGVAGLAISPMLIPASALPHVLFGLLLWALDHYFGEPSAQMTHEAP